jgi:short-subunit dehydrogenase
MLKARGWWLLAMARKEADLARLEQAEGLETLRLELSDPGSVAATAEEALCRTDGKLYALFNSAGIGQIGAVEDLSADLLRRQFEINVVGAHELTRLVLPAMRANNEGRIVQCSSVLGLVAAPYRGVYCASKYAIEALSDALRLELRGTGIAVSIIEPGPIRSRFVETALANFKKTVDIESSPHRSLYRARLLAMEAGGKRAFKLEPEAVAAKLVHAVESRHPRARYFVTTPTYFSAVAKRVLPTALLDRIVVWT